MCTGVLHRCIGATAHDNSATSKLCPGPGQGRGVQVAPNTGDPQTGVPGAARSHLPHKRFTPVSHIAAESSADASDGVQSYLNQDIPSRSPQTRPGSAPVAASHAPAEHIAQKDPAHDNQFMFQKIRSATRIDTLSAATRARHPPKSRSAVLHTSRHCARRGQ